jgi:hypothetical protein
MALSRIAKPRLCTFADFCFLVKDDQKADLIDGVIYMASPENADANELFVWLIGLINLFVQQRDLGKVYGSRVAFRLDDGNGPEPDIGFVRKDRLQLVARGRVNGPPDLALEIVSPESVDRDYKKSGGNSSGQPLRNTGSLTRCRSVSRSCAWGLTASTGKRVPARGSFIARSSLVSGSGWTGYGKSRCRRCWK